MDKTNPCRPRTKLEDKRKPRLPHYGTPVHKQLKWKPLVKTPADCTPLRIVRLQPNRTLSLQDLSPGFQQNITLRRNYICQENMAGSENLSTAVCPDTQTKLLAFLVYGRFLKTIWRKRKEYSEKLEGQLHSSNDQTKRLKAQVETLKALLASDEQMISSSFREVQVLKGVQAALEARHYRALEEKDELEMRSHRLREDLLKAEAEASNSKNSVILVRAEVVKLEELLQKEKDRSAKLKKDNKVLLGKVDDLTNKLKTKCAAFECSEQKMAALEEQMSTIDRALDTLQRQLETVQTRLKEERLAYEFMMQEEVLKTNKLAAELATYKSPPLKTKILLLTRWLVNIPLALATW